MSSYTTQAAITALFGIDNISTWSTMAEGDSEATKTARITTGIAVVSDELDEILRCVTTYESKLPISTVPDSVANKVAIGVGLWLYSFHATDDYPDNKGYMAHLQERYDKWLSEVRNGTRKLNIP